MIKRGVIVAIILILSSIAIAVQDNYNQYKSLELNVKVFTTIDADKRSGNAEIEYLQADLELFPRTTLEQEIISQKVSGEPMPNVKKSSTDINLEWKNLNKDTVTYMVDSEVKTYNKIRQIDTKIGFPIQKLDPDLKIYTEPTEYMDINTEIREKAASIAEGETDLYIVTSKEGEWVRKNIKYNLNTLTANAVQKSSWVYTNKEGVCDEITNLFISMMRSLGVPARFASGVVYSNVAYKFENHGWAEVYLQEYGWVPFDVTFGQYGWIDPSHVKMDESRDSGEASVTYNWKATNLDLRARPLKIETEIMQKEGTMAKLAKLEARPIESDVGFGSYMILEVTAENLQEYYLPFSFAITKSPQTVEENPGAHMVLKPKEKRKFYWTMKIPENLDENYIYTTEIAAESNFAETAVSSIRYGQGFKKYTKEWAEQTYDMLAEREEKTLFTNLGLDCTTDKQHYLSTENAKINCVVKNKGNKNLDKVDVCIRDKCKETSLSISQEKEINFEIELKKSENLTITAESDKYIKEQTISLDVKETPEVKVISYEPDTIGYEESDALVLKIFTKSKAEDILMAVRNVGEIQLKELEGVYTVNVPIKGKIFRKGVIYITINYKNAEGESFTREEKLGITVRNLPWHARLLNWLGL
jgi:hypothetical protein